MIHYFIVTPSVTFLTYVDEIVKNEIKIKKAMSSLSLLGAGLQ
jgi:hypothetical protein